MAYEFYISIEGAKQGAFKGDADAAARRRAKGRIGGVKFSFETTSPRDVATGQASGKRMHKPIVITKEWDAASPQLFNALVTNEVLKNGAVRVREDRIADGQEEIYHTITLTNANVSNVHSYLDLTDTSGDRYDAHELEDVSFVFQKIEIENKEGKTTAADDWHA